MVESNLPLRIAVVGDIHGDWSRLDEIIEKYRDDLSVAKILCVGDLTSARRERSRIPREFDPKFSFIHGNHDDPSEYLNHPNFLGRYGVLEIENRKVFYAGGAYTPELAIDTACWWQNEGLSYSECQQAYNLYVEAKPDMVLSHDCPACLQQEMVELAREKNPATAVFGPPVKCWYNAAFDEMLLKHRPQAWCWGHWHNPWEMENCGTLFRCVGYLEDCILELE